MDTAVAVKDFVDEALTKGQIVALVSLDVKGAFNAAWWPSILKALKDFYCLRNLYNLTKKYFSGKFRLYLNKQYANRHSSKHRLPTRVLLSV
jgi:hypothetical protein